MSFTTPYSPGALSTPDKSRSISSNMSTTPAGVPPSSTASFTPAGPPPSSGLGSSQSGTRRALDFSDSRFNQSTTSYTDNDLLSFSTTSSNFPRDLDSPNSSYLSHRPTRSPLHSSHRSILNKSKGIRSPFDSSRRTPFSQDNEPVTTDARDPEDNGIGWSPSKDGGPFTSSLFQPATKAQPSRLLRKPVIYSNPAGAKRAKLDETWIQSTSPENEQPQKQKKVSNFPSIIKDLTARASLASVDEPSELLLSMEDAICRMYDQVRDRNSDDDIVDSSLSAVSDELSCLWQRYSPAPMEEKDGVPLSGGIGPGDSSPSIMKAIFLSSLLLQLHHPPLLEPSNQVSKSSRSMFRDLVIRDEPLPKVPIPKVLFQWLWRYHDLETIHLDMLQDIQPNPTASPIFWKFILKSVLRAEFGNVITLLSEADFSYARTAMEDGYEQPGYHGSQLQIIQQCVNKALQLLKTCPAVQRDDWDVKGVEWAMFRKHVNAAILDLEDMAENGQSQISDDSDGPFVASHFGISFQRPDSMSFSHSARMAESRIPWSIYLNIKAMYSILCGETENILKQSEDWVEATIALTAWWDGDDDSDISVGGKKKGPVKRRSQAPRAVDSNTEESYLRRLDYAYSSVTDTLGSAGFQINSMNPCEVGLASVCEGNVESVLRLLQTWSLAVSAATAEIASFGGWLAASTGSEPMREFNESDLMVLSYGQPEKPLQKDDILINYADGVFSRDRLGDRGAREGWELSLEVLSRLDDQKLMRTKVRELMDRVSLDTADKMDKAVVLCAEVGFSDEGRRVSERYGDQVAEVSENYGTALICYARAHCSRKIKNVIDLLTSFCLIQSRAYPAKDQLDEQLRSLLYDPSTALSAIASVDSEGAAMLQFYFSSYATLRSYYEIRDEAAGLNSGQVPKHRPLARKREAARALVAVIRSAADSIYGGLYDPDRQSAAQVDGLLVLLGEALALLDPNPNHFLNTEQQLTILAAIEDLQTVTGRVYEQCEACLQSALYHYLHFDDGNNIGTGHSLSDVGRSMSTSFYATSPQKLLKKSISSTTLTSGFSLIGSEMLEGSQSISGSKEMGGSGVLVPRSGSKGQGKGKQNEGQKIQRGWDWRDKAPDGIKGGDILKKLRLLLAHGMAFGALDGANSLMG
ncbi:hypothetical protein H105_03148 [Trichophyton soudanense CBS 452.61]|uniref:Nuclear pore complex protein Nup85 n=1 Tax=Trichophyton soudanense CBS 452.61 TaxID=1215331 RepID=A0A022XY31_TRISD|nr:hypothetical protein H105_03148 [Trichophyton soudanense CBS 452.61]